MDKAKGGGLKRSREAKTARCKKNNWNTETGKGRDRYQAALYYVSSPYTSQLDSRSTI